MEKNYKKALRLEYLTVGYNLIEAFASMLAGGLANSIALIGFGLDSIVESLSGLVMIWRLKKHGIIEEDEERRIESIASRIIGITFFILAAYVLIESVSKIVNREVSDPSLFGIIIAAVSLSVMPFLGFVKYRLGREMGLGSLVADSKQTIACAFLSGALLIGLTARSLFDLWIADPVVALLIVLFLVKEGYELVFGDGDD